MEGVPDHVWSRRFDAKEPSTSVHAQFTPDILEAISLLPVAYRIGSYIHAERSAGRDPIFDLHGITLSPPHPGPHAASHCRQTLGPRQAHPACQVCHITSK
ncbi:hypothetical protein EON65_07570, partial [archaeon]